MNEWRWGNNDPHKKFFDHLLSGGTIYREDKLNNVQEFLTIADLEGDATKILGYGYSDLHIVPVASLSRFTAEPRKIPKAMICEIGADACETVRVGGTGNPEAIVVRYGFEMEN
jgi:hypothetical protein